MSNKLFTTARAMTLGAGTATALLAALFVFAGISHADTTINNLGMTSATNTPMLSNITATTTSDGTGATLMWTTDETATSQVTYGTTTDYGTNSPINSATTTAHTVSLAGLTPNMTYHFQVISTDVSGNTTFSSDQTFMTASTSAAATTTASTTAPLISSVTASSSADGISATIDWTTDQPATSQIAFGLSSGSYSATTTADSNLVTGHSTTLTGLTPDTTYHFLVLSNNADAMTGTSTDQMFTTSSTTATTTASTTAPLITSILPTSSADGMSETIMWTTDQPATSQVSFGTTSGVYPTSTTADSGLVTSHSQILTGLTPGTEYFFYVTSLNSASMPATSTEETFTPVITTGTGTGTTTSSSTSSDFTLSASTGTTNPLIGSPMDITVMGANNGIALPPGLIDVEVFDPSGTRVYQNQYDQDFGNASTSSNTFSLTPMMNGLYTVKVGAFSSDWLTNYAWNFNALTFTVGGTSTTSTSTGSEGSGGTTTTPPVTSYPNISLVPVSQTVTAGQHVDFNGRNFPHEEDINVYQNGTWVSKAHADGGGNFTTGSLTMPMSAGTYTYTFVGATTGVTMSSSITVQ